jgi:hypothetical protein
LYLAASRVYERPGVYATPLSARHVAHVFAAAGRPDSLLVLSGEKQLLTAFFAVPGYRVVGPERDTVLQFMPDRELFQP